MKKPRIGFIGQGWIGKNYADDFENRGYEVIRYSQEEPYIKNKGLIAECDIVFIAVPTPTTKNGSDNRIVDAALPLVGKGKIAVIKSTISIGSTEILQKNNKHCIILHSPEFLTKATASYDASHPERTIIGIPLTTGKNKKEWENAVEKVLSVLPESPYTLICSSSEAEFIKYVHNIHGYVQIVFSNIIYDLGKKNGVDWKTAKGAFMNDSMMSHRYLDPIHKSGRGAGGHCFIKDFEAFIGMYKHQIKDSLGEKMLTAIRDKNIDLLKKSKKDLDIIKEVYNKKTVKKIK